MQWKTKENTARTMLSQKRQRKELFADDEFGFDMFIMMKTVEPSMKHFAFYEGPTGREHDFKLKVQNSIVKSIRDLFLDEEAEYAMAGQGAIKIFFTS